MKILLFIAILLAHTLNGWGGLIAAEVCPHVRQNANAANADDANTHACCVVSAETEAEPHCASMSQVEQATQAASSVVMQSPGATLTTSCVNCCAESSELPRLPAVAQQQTSAGRDLDALSSTSTSNLFVGTGHSFAPKIVPTQNAPPDSLRRHLLLKVFLI